jgi:hypothetical protein
MKDKSSFEPIEYTSFCTHKGIGDMKMKIEWLLDEEEPLDPENLIGDITLTEGEATIIERNTYVDS